MKKQHLFSLLVLFFLMGNFSLFGKNTSPIHTDPPILFLFLEIEKNANEAPVFYLQKIISNKGKLKKKTRTLEGNPEKGMLRCSFLKNDGTLSHQMEIENPLLEKLEYVTEDDQLAWVEIPHEKKEFMIRTQGIEGMTYLLIEWIDENGQLQNSGRIEIGE